MSGVSNFVRDEQLTYKQVKDEIIKQFDLFPSCYGKGFVFGMEIQAILDSETVTAGGQVLIDEMERIIVSLQQKANDQFSVDLAFLRSLRERS